MSIEYPKYGLNEEYFLRNTFVSSLVSNFLHIKVKMQCVAAKLEQAGVVWGPLIEKRTGESNVRCLRCLQKNGQNDVRFGQNWRNS